MEKPAWVEDIIWRRIEDEVVVITEDGLSVHVLNKTAAHIWELCDGRHDLNDIADMVCERFEVSVDEAKADVKAMLAQLEGLGLLRPENGLADDEGNA